MVLAQKFGQVVIFIMGISSMGKWKATGLLHGKSQAERRNTRDNGSRQKCMDMVSWNLKVKKNIDNMIMEKRF